MNTVAKNSVHLAAGSTCPALQPDLLRIYSMFFCPYAQRTRIVLNFKNVKHETVNVHLRQKPDWFLKINPIAKVPTLQLGDNIIYESMITCDYLNDAYPDPPLYPSDRWAKAVDQGFVEVFQAKVISPLHKILYYRKEDSELDLFAEGIRNGLELFEEELKKRGSKFFFGKRPGMLDYAIFPWFERFPMVEKVFANFEILSEDRFPTLRTYSINMHEDEAAKSTLISIDDHTKFLSSFTAGQPNYDIGC